MTELRIEDLRVDRNGATLVKPCSCTLRTGELVALLGPNGAGKSTLLRTALGLTPRSGGRALLAGEDTAHLDSARRARMVSYLPQRRPLAWPSPVHDVVALGRFSHGASLGRLSAADEQATAAALDACDLNHLAQRATDTLSGGELSRVHLARAFAAQAPLLVADEPVAALDPRHQYLAMALIRAFVDAGNGALVVLHEVDLAARFADRLIWMQGGRLVSDGPPQETLTQARMAEVYGVRAQIDGVAVRIDGVV
ncbi:MAG: ABC transporter ATP-binding protein [Pseudomonadota bacterium]